MDRKDVWEPVLEDGERLVWSGRPDTGLRFRRNDWIIVLIAVLMAGMAIYFFASDALEDAPGWFLAFMGGMGALGLLLVPHHLWREQRMRQNLHYALTDRRALVLHVGQRKLLAYPLAETNRLDLSRYGKFGIVFFKDEYVSIGGRTLDRNHPKEIGFEYIPDADAVMEHMRVLGAGRSYAQKLVTGFVRRRFELA